MGDLANGIAIIGIIVCAFGLAVELPVALGRPWLTLPWHAAGEQGATTTHLRSLSVSVMLTGLIISQLGELLNINGSHPTLSNMLIGFGALVVVAGLVMLSSKRTQANKSNTRPHQ